MRWTATGAAHGSLTGVVDRDADSGAAGSVPLLSVRQVGKRYPGTVALTGIDLDVRAGEVVALLGENGAGKSTLARIIAGVEAPTSGTMEWQGRAYAPTSPLDAIRAGVGMIHQEMRLLPDLTVAENVFVGRWPRLARGSVDHRAMREEARGHLERLGFSRPMSTLVRDLSVAGQQQVEIAKALSQRSRLIILDEPTAALGGEETQALFACVRDLQADGVAFVYVSHRLAEIAQIATRVVVLRDGTQVAQHASARVPPEDLVAEMVGRRVDRLFPPLTTPGERVVLRASGISAANGFVRDVDLEVREGEVLGIAGLVGAGRTELVRAVAGADTTASGTVWVEGSRLRARSIRAAKAAGLVMVPEDRRRQGLLTEASVRENVSLPNFDKVCGPSGWLSRSRAKALANDVISQMGVKGDPGKKVGQLSGGNQQKVVIGKWVARSPKVVILDEPTRGVDVGARASVYEVVDQLRRRGVAVVVVSSDLEEVIGLSHRVMVLSRGRVQGVLDHEEADGERIISMATR